MTHEPGPPAARPPGHSPTGAGPTSTGTSTGTTGAGLPAGLAEIMAEVLPPGDAGGRRAFGHRSHLHLAFLAVSRYGMPAAAPLVGQVIRQVAASHGTPQKYHETMTRAWTGIVAYHMAADAPGPQSPAGDRRSAGDFGVFTDRHPALLDKRLLARHYRPATLAGRRPGRAGSSRILRRSRGGPDG